MFNLMRNIGSSIGISVVEALLVRNTQVMHAALAAHVTQLLARGARASSGGTAVAALNAQRHRAGRDDRLQRRFQADDDPDGLSSSPLCFLLRDVPARQSVAVVLE